MLFGLALFAGSLLRYRQQLQVCQDQARAAGVLREGVASGRYGTTLLKGVTGSGKTEVYLEAVAEALQ